MLIDHEIARANSNFGVVPRLESDSDVLKRMSQGDKRAMAKFFARHNLRVYRFALRIVNNESTAEDVVSEVFFEAWRRAEDFRCRSQVSTWLLAITRNLAISKLRKHSMEELEDCVAEQMLDPGDNPEIAIEKKQQYDLLSYCLTKLSPAHREIIDLTYYHERSIRDVAEITGVPVNTVKTRMFYARSLIAKYLEEVQRERATGRTVRSRMSRNRSVAISRACTDAAPKRVA